MQLNNIVSKLLGIRKTAVGITNVIRNQQPCWIVEHYSDQITILIYEAELLHQLALAS